MLASIMDIFWIKATNSLTMALQNELSEWRDTVTEKSRFSGKLFIVFGAEIGYALTCLIGVVETVARFALSFPLGVFGVLLDKISYNRAVELTILSSVISLSSTVSSFISLFTNLHLCNQKPSSSQINEYAPCITPWINSFFSTPQELWQRQSIKGTTLPFCFSYDFLVVIHRPQGPLTEISRSREPLIKNLFELIGTVSVVFFSMIEFLLAIPSDTIKSLFKQVVDYGHTKATVLTWYLALATLYEKYLRFDRLFIDIQKEYLAS